MSSKLVRHQRIINLRTMALKGATYDELEQMCKKMGLSLSSTRSYLQEVIDDLTKQKKANKRR